MPFSCEDSWAGIEQTVAALHPTSTNDYSPRARLFEALPPQLSIAHVFDFALRIARDFLIQEKGHSSPVTLAIYARDKRLPSAAGTRQNRRRDLVSGRYRVRYRDGAYPVAGGAR